MLTTLLRNPCSNITKNIRQHLRPARRYTKIYI
jgi:hypothetical protein